MKSPISIEKHESWKMFNDISSHYDLLNRLLSLGLDIRWRKALARLLPTRPRLNVLDLATGTADVLLSLFKNNVNVKTGIGVDMADKMLEIGRQKIEKLHLTDRIQLKEGDANRIPGEDNTFDCATIAFGIRNVTDPSIVLKEMNRVLKTGGRALILEFSLPDNKILRALHLFYLRTVVPCIGGLVSGHYAAYKYLNTTIESFPYGDAFCQLMQNAGFEKVKANPLLFGVATIYQGDVG